MQVRKYRKDSCISRTQTFKHDFVKKKELQKRTPMKKVGHNTHLSLISYLI